MFFLTKTFGISKIIFLLSMLFLSYSYDLRADVLCKEGCAPEINGEIVKGDFLKLLKCLDSFIKKGKSQSVPSDDGKYHLKPVVWINFNSGVAM